MLHSPSANTNQSIGAATPSAAAAIGSAPSPTLTAQEFLRQVIAWPGPNDPGFACLTWWSPNKDQPDPKQPRHKLWTSRCFCDPDAMVSFAGWLMQQPNPKDIYFCTALLNEHGEPSKSGKGYKAKRLARNVLNHKCLFCDIDIKEKGYPDHKAAVQALRDAVGKDAIPMPDLMVDSGGGLHVYWVCEKPLDPVQWQQAAGALVEYLRDAGIKFDSQCTVDQVRIQRLPQTLNHKFTPPRLVKCWG